MASLMSPPYMDVGAGLTTADGAKLFFYVVGSATPKDTYTTAAATVAHANPVIADAKGVFDAIYLSGDYDWVLKDKNDVQRNSGSVSEFVTATDTESEYVINRATLAAATTDTTMKTGYAVNLAERTTGNGGGGMWDVIAGTGTANTYNIVAHDTLSLSFVLRIEGILYADQIGIDAAAIQYAIDLCRSNGYILEGGNKTFAVTGRIAIQNNITIQNLHLDFDDADATSYQLWIGNSTQDAPTTPNSGYTGTEIHIINMNVKPSTTCLTPVRFRGLLDCTFTGLNIAPTLYQDAPDLALYCTLDAMVNTHFYHCNWRPSTGYDSSSSPNTTVMNMSQMLNLAATVSAGNGLTCTSTTFNQCYIHLATYLGQILGDNISFNDCILESCYQGWTVIETGSVISFNDCYWENINLFKIYARGVDNTLPATHVRVIGGKVQSNDDNGSLPDHAFGKVKHCYKFEISGVVFQGKPQTRLVEIVAGGTSRKDCLIIQDLNTGTAPRNSSSEVVSGKTMTITNTDATMSIASTAHGLLTGDVIDITVSDQADPYLGLNQLLPNLVVTKVDADIFTVESNLAASGSGTSTVTYVKYKGSSTCLAKLDAPDTTVVTRGLHQCGGQNAYSFNNTWTETVRFLVNTAGAAAAVDMAHNGVNDYVSNDVAYIKSVKYFDEGTVSADRKCEVYYGGNTFTAHEILQVNNDTANRRSTLTYNAPYRVHPFEPITVKASTAGTGTNFPRDLVCEIELVHTGITYDNDTAK